MRGISLSSFEKKCFNCVNLLNKHYHIAAYTHEGSNSTNISIVHAMQIYRHYSLACKSNIKYCNVSHGITHVVTGELQLKK